MKFRIFSIFAGIGQAIAVFAFLWLEMFVLDAFVDDWTMTDNLSIIIAVGSLIACAFLILFYPIRLFRRQQKSDCVVVIVSSVISILLFLGTLFLMVELMFRGID